MLTEFKKLYKKNQFVVYGFLSTTEQYSSFCGVDNAKEAFTAARIRAKHLNSYTPTDKDNNLYKPNEIRVLDLNTGKDIAIYNKNGLVEIDRSYGRKIKHSGVKKTIEIIVSPTVKKQGRTR